MSISPEAWIAEVQVRPFLSAETIPYLARPLVAAGEGKPRGARRLVHRVFKRLHLLIHRRLGCPAEGRLALTGPDGAGRAFPADFGNTGYIDALRRLAKGGYEPDVTDVFEALAPHVKVAYDIGANWGYFTALLASNPVFSGQVHGFEIAPRTYRDYVRMIDRAGLSDRVTAHAFGLSDQDGSVAIAEGSHTGLTRIVDQGGTATVPVRRLDDLDLPPPDLIKMDVEGHEAGVLRGARCLLEGARPIVVLENWGDQRDVTTMLEPLHLLIAEGYRLYRIAWGVGNGTLGSALVPWRPENAAGAVNRLTLVPLSVAERPLIDKALNIVAIHPWRHGDLLAGFAPLGAVPDGS